MDAMATTCDFVREYIPPQQGPETELFHHLRTCTSCREQAHVVDQNA